MVLGLALVSGCVNPSSMAPPVYHFTSGGSVCNSSVVMEAHREVWTESGCELTSSGWKKIATATEAQAARVRQAFDALPAAPNACDGAATSARATLTRRTKDGTSKWIACTGQDGAVAAPFAEAVTALQSLQP